MEQFDCFSAKALGFLTELKANNTKDWFTANKATYEEYVKEPGKAFADDMALALQKLTGQSHSSKIFRIHRDVRFSKDKTPYNAHLHIAFRPDGQSDQPPMWFFGLASGKLSLGCGVFQYDKDALEIFRSAMAGPQGAKLIQLTAKMQAAGFRVGDPDLKRVPTGFDKDHPNKDALRRKGFAVWIESEDPEFATDPNLTERTSVKFSQLMPVFELLSQIK